MGRSKLRRSGNIESRIAQLEELQRPRDEILVVWRPPGAPVSKALRNVDYGPGDRVVCFEWFGTSAPPQPQWRSDLRHWLSKEESDSIDIMLKHIIDAKPSHDLHRCSDEEIFYLLFGVPDGRMIRKLLRHQPGSIAQSDKISGAEPGCGRVRISLRIASFNGTA
jgi:hypothetical protein